MKNKTTLLAAAVFALAASASAATVTFSGQNYADNLISTGGTSVSAFNFGSAAAITSNPTVINTVSFATYSANAGTITTGATTFIHAGATGQGANGAGDGTTLTRTGVFNTAGSGTNAGLLTYGGLTVGNQYEVQMVFSDTRALGGDVMKVSANATARPVSFDFTTADIGTAQLVTGTFTADTATQNFWLTQVTGVGTFDGYIGAIQLRDVTAIPEPSTYGLMGAGALAAVALVRRRKTADIGA